MAAAFRWSSSTRDHPHSLLPRVHLACVDALRRGCRPRFCRRRRDAVAGLCTVSAAKREREAGDDGVESAKLLIQCANFCPRKWLHRLVYSYTVDLDKPLVFEVGHLEEQYQD